MNKEFIKWIRDEMKAMGLTQKEVAGDIVARTQVSQVLSGVSNPGEKFYLAISEAFKVPLDEVYYRAGLKQQPPDTDVPEQITRKLIDLSPEHRQTAEQFIDYLRATEKEKDQELIEKAQKLTEDQRRRAIDTGATLKKIRDRKPPDSQPASNPDQPEKECFQSPLL